LRAVKLQNSPSFSGDHIRCRFLGFRHPVICKFGNGLSEITLAMNEDDEF
jgi:hypothetical protein